MEGVGGGGGPSCFISGQGGSKSVINGERGDGNGIEDVGGHSGKPGAALSTIASHNKAH